MSGLNQAFGTAVETTRVCLLLDTWGEMVSAVKRFAGPKLTHLF